MNFELSQVRTTTNPSRHATAIDVFDDRVLFVVEGGGELERLALKEARFQSTGVTVLIFEPTGDVREQFDDERRADG